MSLYLRSGCTDKEVKERCDGGCWEGWEHQALPVHGVLVMAAMEEEMDDNAQGMGGYGMENKAMNAVLDELPQENSREHMC